MVQSQAHALHEAGMDKYSMFKQRAIEANLSLVSLGTGLVWTFAGMLRSRFRKASNPPPLPLWMTRISGDLEMTLGAGKEVKGGGGGPGANVFLPRGGL